MQVQLRIQNYGLQLQLWIQLGIHVSYHRYFGCNQLIKFFITNTGMCEWVPVGDPTKAMSAYGNSHYVNLFVGVPWPFTQMSVSAKYYTSLQMQQKHLMMAQVGSYSRSGPVSSTVVSTAVLVQLVLCKLYTFPSPTLITIHHANEISACLTNCPLHKVT